MSLTKRIVAELVQKKQAENGLSVDSIDDLVEDDFDELQNYLHELIEELK